MSIKNATKKKLLAGAGTTVLATLIAGGAYAAEVTIPNLVSATASGHETGEAVTTNSGSVAASVSDAHGKLGVTGDQSGTSNAVTTNTIRAGAIGTTFTNDLDLSLIEDNDVEGNSGVAALGVATNMGVVTSSVTDSLLSIDLAGAASDVVAVNTDNTIRSQSTVNAGKTTVAGAIPNGYVSQTEGRSAVSFPTGLIHAADGSVVVSSVQLNSAAGHAASVEDNGIGLALRSDTIDGEAEASPTLDRNTIDATMAVNSAGTTADLKNGGAPAFEGSAVVSNLQSNLNGSASAANSGSEIAAVVTGIGGSALNKLEGGLSVQDNAISSSVSGNQSTGMEGKAGNRILIGDQLAVRGAGTTGPLQPGSAVAYDAGEMDAGAIADLVIMNSQGNSGLSDLSIMTLSSITANGIVGAVVDSLDGGSVTLAGNAVTSQALGNSASSEVQSGKDSAEFDATVALLSQQINHNANVMATMSQTAVTAVVGSATGGVTNESTVTVSDNISAARAYGNDVGQKIALDANTLNGAAGFIDLTGGTTGPSNDGNASASGAVTITNLQSIYNGNVTAANDGSTIGLDADTRIATPDDLIGSSSLSTGANKQEAVALGSSASSGISLTGNTVGSGAGIASVQIGDAESAVSSTLSNASVGLIASTHVADSTLSVAGNLQRAIGYGTMAGNTLSVEANNVNVAVGGAGAGGAYDPDGNDPFHQYTDAIDYSQPTIEAAFAVLNDQSIQGPVTAAAEGMTGLSVEGDIRASAATNNGNALVAAAYGNDAANGIALDAGTLDTTGFASVAHIGNAQAVSGASAGISATASGGNVVFTDIEDNVLGSTVSTSTNQVQAQAYGSKASNSLGVSGNAIDTSGAGVQSGLSLDGGELSNDTSFGVTNAQAGAGSVSASLLDNPIIPATSASVLTRIGGNGTIIAGSSVASDNNSLSAQATSNSADNALGIQANAIASASGVMNFQITDADVSATIGIAGAPDGLTSVPFSQTANLVTAGQTEVDGDILFDSAYYRIAKTSLTGNQIDYLLDNGWADSGLYVTIDYTGPNELSPSEFANIQTYLATGATQEWQAGTPNIGGVTIMAEGAAIIGSTLSVDGNKVNGAVTGNVATNTLSVASGTIASGSGLTTAASQADASLTTVADHSVVNQQAVGGGELDSTVAGSFGIATEEGAVISGSSLSVSGNSQRAASVANTAANTLSLDGNIVAAGSALLSAQNSFADVSAYSDMEVFAPAAVSASSIDISGNSSTALGVINDATNTSTVSATNIATLGVGALTGEVGNAVLDLEDLSAIGDHVLQNMQAATTSVESTAVASLYNVDREALATSGLSGGSFTMNGNTTYAEASANRAANAMTLNGNATQGANGGVANLQNSSADVTANATTSAGVALTGAVGIAAQSGGTATVDGNKTTALAQGNSATNVLNSVAGANYGSSVGTAGVEFSAIGDSSVRATATMLNAQSNSGDVAAHSAGTTYAVALNAVSAGNPAIANGTVSVSGNSVAAQAFGNNAVNRISLAGLNTGTSTVALGSTQSNSGVITASVTGANVGLDASGSAGGSSFSVGSNTISANAVGNSVSNIIRRK